MLSPYRLLQFALLLLTTGMHEQAFASVITSPPDAYFDPPANGTSYVDNFRVVGSLEPVDWSWGRIELLEGYQNYRTEGYNLRTQKLRYQDTWQDSDYPLQTYFGELNQEIVEGFNLYYRDLCADEASTQSCHDPGPTRPEARFVLLHLGPETAAQRCDASQTPVLLVHGAMQNANTWLYPYGNDGSGNAYPGYDQLEGFVQTLEQNRFCTFALTYGNFHGDNFSQAINLSNVLERIGQLSGQQKVDVVAWSKGVVPVDLYLAEPATWSDFGASYFERIAAQQAMAVPLFDEDIRTFVSLSGPHKGIDLNWRHPYDDLLIFSTAENAPVGQGPVVWTSMMAVQCVTWGYYDSPDDPWWPNPYAYSVCENRGATWADFWNKIITSNISGLDGEGRPTYEQTLRRLNTSQGLDDVDFDFDTYNISLFGAVDEDGNYQNGYLGQLQVVNDLREDHPIEARDYLTQDWTSLDTDYYNWYWWLILKMDYDPYSLSSAGWMDSSLPDCRETAYEPDAFPCLGTHRYIKRRNAESVSNRRATYKLMDGLGIATAMELSGFFSERLERHGLSSQLDYLFVVNGTTLGPEGYNFEIDGLDCPDCDPQGDAVLFEESIGELAYQQLTQSWSESQKACHSQRQGVPVSHLEAGVEAQVWSVIMNKLNEVDVLSCSSAITQ